MTKIIKKNIEFWESSAKDNYKLAGELFKSKQWKLESLFFMHLAIEKLLKGLFVIKSGNLPLLIHDLLKLAQKAEIEISLVDSEFLILLSEYNIAGRYPEYKNDLRKETTNKKYQDLFTKSVSYYKWLLKLLDKQKTQ